MNFHADDKTVLYLNLYTCVVYNANVICRTFMNYAKFIVMDFFYLAFFKGKTQTHLPKRI